ncbi:MAG: hypothetical protein K0U93_13885 [Gammaproteobacteria bacterium]|nr:hypothetical protein [Gammaproteobacteria bacterium]
MKKTTLVSAFLCALFVVPAPASAEPEVQAQAQERPGSIDRGLSPNPRDMIARLGEFDGQVINAALAYSIAGEAVVDFGSISGTSEMMWVVAFDEQGRVTYYLLSNERWSERSPPGGSYLGGYLVVMKSVANTTTYDPGYGVNVPVLGNDEDAFQVTTMDWFVLVEEIADATKSTDATIVARSLPHAYSVRTVTAMPDLHSVATAVQILDPSGEVIDEWDSDYAAIPTSGAGSNVDCAAFGEEVADWLVFGVNGAEVTTDALEYLVEGAGLGVIAGATAGAGTLLGGVFGSGLGPEGTVGGAAVGGSIGAAQGAVGAFVWHGAVSLFDTAHDAAADALVAVIETDGKDFATSRCQDVTNQTPDGPVPPGRAPPTGGGTTHSPEGYFGYLNLCEASATEMDSDNSNGSADTDIADTDPMSDDEVSEEIVVYGERVEGDEDECIEVEIWIEQ